MPACRPLLLFVLVLLAGPAFAGAELAKAIPADTKLVVRINLAAVRDSKLYADWSVAHDAKITAAKTFLGQVAGVDLDLVSRFWMIACKPDTGVFVFDGAFNVEQVQGHLAAIPNMTAVIRPGCSYVVRFKDDKKDRMMLGALLDEHLLVVGDEASVDHFLDAVQGKVPALPADDAQLQKLLADKHTVVLTMFGGPKDWPDFNKDDMGQYLSSVVTEFWLTGDLTADAQLALTLTADTAAHAEGLEFALRGLAKLMVDSPAVAAKPLLASLLKTAQVARKERTVTVLAVLPGVDIMSATAKF